MGEGVEAGESEEPRRERRPFATSWRMGGGTSLRAGAWFSERVGSGRRAAGRWQAVQVQRRRDCRWALMDEIGQPWSYLVHLCESSRHASTVAEINWPAQFRASTMGSRWARRTGSHLKPPRPPIACAANEVQGLYAGDDAISQRWRADARGQRSDAPRQHRLIRPRRNHARRPSPVPPDAGLRLELEPMSVV